MPEDVCAPPDDVVVLPLVPIEKVSALTCGNENVVSAGSVFAPPPNRPPRREVSEPSPVSPPNKPPPPSALESAEFSVDFRRLLSSEVAEVDVRFELGLPNAIPVTAFAFNPSERSSLFEPGADFPLAVVLISGELAFDPPNVGNADLRPDLPPVRRLARPVKLFFDLLTTSFLPRFFQDRQRLRTPCAQT